MTIQVEEQEDVSDEIFAKFSEACEGYEFSEVVMASIDLIVACVKESGDDEFASSVINGLLSAASFLAETGAGDQVEEKPLIQLLN